MAKLAGSRVAPGKQAALKLRPAQRNDRADSSARKLTGRPPQRPYAATSDHAPLWLRVPAGYAWRIIVIGAAVYFLAVIAGSLALVFVALFFAAVLTAILRPVTNVFDRFMPRPLAVVVSILTALGVMAGIFAFIGVSVAGQWEDLSKQVTRGVGEILDWVRNADLPFSITADQVTESIETGVENIQDWIQKNWSALATSAVSGAGIVVEFFTGLVLGVFCAVFFINSGSKIWAWFLEQVPSRAREAWSEAGDAAWSTFSGYTRGIFIVAATNGLFAGIALTILRVPLSAPLGVLVFLGTFIPLIGSPLAMIVAVIVALAANGPLVALAVLVLIVLIGQFEGNVLQPLVMGKQVDLHPVAVALSVAAGTIIAGVMGAIVAVPVVSVVWAVFARLRRRHSGELDLESELVPEAKNDP